MSSLEENLQQWIVNELNPLSEGVSSSIPDLSTLSRLTTTPENKEVFNFLVSHVRSQSNAEKVRRILKAKHQEEERKRNMFIEPPFAIDPSNLHQEISKANEKCAFLKSSISDTKARIESTVQTIRELRAEIDILKQKSSFMETFICKYREKILLLISLREQLETGRFVDPKKAKHPRNEIDIRFNYVLCLISSVVKKELKQEGNVESTFENISNNVDQKVKTILLADLMFTLRSLSETAFNNILKDMDKFSKDGLIASPSVNLKLSLKHLQNFKMQHVHSVFTTKKTKMEMEDLRKIKDSLAAEKLESLTNKNYTDFERRCQLFENMVEIRCLEESIKLLGMILSKEQNESTALEGKNDLQASASQDLELVVKKFYHDFDLLRRLLEWAYGTFKKIIESVSCLYTFANNNVFAGSNLTYSPLELEKTLGSEMEMFWDACEHNDVIKSSLYDPQRSTSSLCDAIEMQQFHNDVTVARNIKQVKDDIREIRGRDFSIDNEQFMSAYHCYAAMSNILQEMQSELDKGDFTVGRCSKYVERTTVALKDWWDQDAQYILDLSYDNKTLKMWQDILKLLSDFNL